MKRRMTFSLTLTLSLLLSLVSLPSTQAAPPPQRFRFDSGVVTPSATQRLRITASGGIAPYSVRIRWMQYGAQGCSGMPPVCRHMVVSQGTTPVEALDPDDALSFDLNGTGVQGAGAVRAVVDSNSPNTRVLGVVFDTSTQRIIAVYQVNASVNVP